MKHHLIFYIIIAILLWPVSGHAKSNQTEDPWAHLTSLATQVEQTVEQHDNKAALTFLDAFSKEWKTLQNDQLVHLNDVQIRTLSACLDNLQKELQVNADPVKLKQSSVEFRLAVDAISTEGTPLWISMGNQIIASFNTVKEDVKAGDDQKFQVDLNKFMDLYQMVYPSMAIDVQSNRIIKIDAEVSDLAKQRMTFLQKRKQDSSQQLQTLGGNLHQLFHQQVVGAGITVIPSIDVMILSIGGLIVITLLYASWRKYKGTDPDIV